MTIQIALKSGSRFALAGHDGQPPVHDTVAPHYRHLHFCQHPCFLNVRAARVNVSDRSVRQVSPDFEGKLSGFTLPVGTSYAVWVGVDAAGAALLGILLLGESANAGRPFSQGLIVAGIAGLKLATPTQALVLAHA